MYVYQFCIFFNKHFKENCIWRFSCLFHGEIALICQNKTSHFYGNWRFLLKNISSTATMVEVAETFSLIFLLFIIFYLMLKVLFDFTLIIFTEHKILNEICWFILTFLSLCFFFFFPFTIFHVTCTNFSFIKLEWWCKRIWIHLHEPEVACLNSCPSRCE